MTRRRITGVIVVALFLACGYIVWRSEAWVPLVYEVTFERRQHRDGAVRARLRKARFWRDSIGDRFDAYFEDSGYQWAWATGMDTSGARRGTVWHAHGRVHYQGDKESGEFRSAPPWLWGVTDQAKPDPPAWFYRDELFEGSQ